MQDMRFPFLDLATVNAPYIDGIREAVERVIVSGRYIGGAEVSRFESALALSTGTDYAVGVSNGLDALRLIFRAYIEMGRLHPGDMVVVPDNTYIASALAVSDVEAWFLCLPMSRLKPSISTLLPWMQSIIRR